MPDRNDTFVNDDRVPISEETSTIPGNVSLAPVYEDLNPRFNPETEQSLADYPQYPHNDPWDTSENRRPDETFTAYVKRIEKRVYSRPALPITGTVVGGEQTLAGFSFYNNGADLVFLRDGIDGSAPIVYVINPNALTNQWFGLDGLHFQYGIYLDLTAANATFVRGAFHIVQEYSV